MSRYARSDMDYVAISLEGGGCGRSHIRPVIEGAPVKIWRLDCLPCEAVLATSDLWAGTISEIPETPDEARAREDLQTRGAKDRDQIMALALAKLAGMPEAADALQSLMGGRADAAVPADLGTTRTCPDGHTNSAAVKFCGECGHNFAAAKTAAGASAAAKIEALINGRDLNAMNLTTVRGIARAGGLDYSGTKAELIGRIKAATGETPPGPQIVDLTKLKLPELRAHAERFGLDATGTKTDLLDRLMSVG